MLVGEAAPSGPVGRKVLASRASQFFASAEGLLHGDGGGESERGDRNGGSEPGDGRGGGFSDELFCAGAGGHFDAAGRDDAGFNLRRTGDADGDDGSAGYS